MGENSLWKSWRVAEERYHSASFFQRAELRRGRRLRIDRLMDSDTKPMRGFLRVTSALATMHRIAGTFLSGAGLLLLIPAFIRGGFADAWQFISRLPGPLDTKMPLFVMLSACAFLPLYALYLLVRDLVQFYFVAQHVGDAPGDFLPRF